MGAEILRRLAKGCRASSFQPPSDRTDPQYELLAGKCHQGLSFTVVTFLDALDNRNVDSKLSVALTTASGLGQLPHPLLLPLYNTFSKGGGKRPFSTRDRCGHSGKNTTPDYIQPTEDRLCEPQLHPSGPPAAARVNGAEILGHWCGLLYSGSDGVFPLNWLISIPALTIVACLVGLGWYRQQ